MFSAKPQVTKGSTVVLESSPKWRSMVDNCTIEFIASLFLILATVFCWSWKDDNPLLQFVPPLAMGLVLLCLKDEVRVVC
jgi:glycerol uptake facilitator-like aquaporin